MCLDCPVNRTFTPRWKPSSSRTVPSQAFLGLNTSARSEKEVRYSWQGLGHRRETPDADTPPRLVRPRQDAAVRRQPASASTQVPERPFRRKRDQCAGTRRRARTNSGGKSPHNHFATFCKPMGSCAKTDALHMYSMSKRSCGWTRSMRNSSNRLALRCPTRLRLQDRARGRAWEVPVRAQRIPLNPLQRILRALIACRRRAFSGTGSRVLRRRQSFSRKTARG